MARLAFPNLHFPPSPSAFPLDDTPLRNLAPWQMFGPLGENSMFLNESFGPFAKTRRFLQKQKKSGLELAQFLGLVIPAKSGTIEGFRSSRRRQVVAR
jgi:hypothetical protein